MYMKPQAVGGNQWYDRPSIRINRHLGRNLALSCFGHRVQELWCKPVQYFSMKRTHLATPRGDGTCFVNWRQPCVSVWRTELGTYCERDFFHFNVGRSALITCRR